MTSMSAAALKGTLLIGSMLVAGMTVSAAPIDGTIGFSGTRLFSFTLPAGPGQGSYIDFQNPIDGGVGALVAGGTEGFFDIVPTFDPGFIKDLATGPNSLGYAIAPPGATVSIDNFLTFSSIPGVNIRLTQLPLATNCDANVVCVGAFQLVQNGAAVSVSLNILGDILNGADSSPFSGQITAQFLGASGTGTTVQAVIDEASSPTGVLSNSWSGAITTAPIPEPGTVTMLGIGAIAMLLAKVRTTRRSSSN